MVPIPSKVEQPDFDYVEGVRETAIIWPWDLLHYLWEQRLFFQWVADECVAENNSEVAQTAVATYWDHVRNEPFFAQHEFQNNETATCVPLFFHTDGVKIYKAQKAWIYSYCSACRKGPSLQTKMVSILVREALLIKDTTHDSIGRLHGYMMYVLRTGKFPDKDSSGQPWPAGSTQARRAGSHFAGGWTCAFAGFKSDWEAKAIVHKMLRHYSCVYICEHCPAARNHIFSFGNFRLDAPHRSVRFSHEQFQALNPPRNISSWTTVKGWTKDRNLDDPRPGNL